MKLLLFYPPEENLMDTAMPEILEKGVGFSPPLGILYIAASVKRHTNWEVKIVDCVAEGFTYAQIRERINAERPEVVGVTVMTHKLIDSLEIAKITKRLDPKIKVIFGGPHVHIYPKETVSFDVVDYVIIGEAENSVVDFLNAWDRPDRLSAIPGLYSKGPNGIICGPLPDFIDDLDGLAHPSRDISQYKLYNSTLSQEEIVTAMVTSRGCPFKCVFCDRPNLGRKFRARSANDVVNEMQECTDLGIKYIKVYDDTFTVDRERVMAICDKIKKRKLNISWDIRAHVNTIDFEMLKSLKETNCKLICYGVESGNSEVLKRLRKGITKERVMEVFSLTRKAGIQALAYFMLGCPGETREQMLETIEFAKKLNPDFCHFSIFVPFPCTPIYMEALEKGFFPHDYWREFAQNPTVDFKPELWIENVPKEQMQKLLIKAYRGFYLRPLYMIRKTLEARSFSELKRKFHSAFCLFKDN